MWPNRAGEKAAVSRKQQRWSRWGARKQAAELTPAGRGCEPEPVAAVPEDVSRSKPVIAGMQRRTFARALRIEKRSAAQGGWLLRGSMPFNVDMTLVDGYVEKLKPGCFLSSIEADDPRVLAFLNMEKVLGRKSAGTARFWEDRAALHFEADVPNTGCGNDLLVSMERGDINAADVVFRVMAFDWGKAVDGSNCRVITRAELICTSVTSFGTYQTLQMDAKGELAAARAEGFRAGAAARASRKEPKTQSKEPVAAMNAGWPWMNRAGRGGIQR